MRFAVCMALLAAVSAEDKFAEGMAGDECACEFANCYCADGQEVGFIYEEAWEVFKKAD